MRKLVYAINTTLDGCCDHTKFGPDEDTFEYVTHLTRAADTFLWGRTTYQLMVPYWPDVAKEDPFLVHPIVVGEGRRVFEGINLQEKLQLKLVESKTFKSGSVALRYLKQ